MEGREEGKGVSEQKKCNGQKAWKKQKKVPRTVEQC